MKLPKIFGVAVPLLCCGCAMGLGGASVQVEDSDGNVYLSNNGLVGPMKTAVSGSYCPGNLDENCEKYGALYSYDAAKKVCESVGGTLPSVSESGGLGAYKDQMRGLPMV